MSRHLLVGAVLLAALLGACASPYELDCRDTLPPGEATFERLQELAVKANPKACSRCHNTRTPVRALNFEGPGVAYDAFISRPAVIYEQVASGSMPQGGPAWSEDDLRLLRSWYCDGAPYAH